MGIVGGGVAFLVAIGVTVFLLGGKKGDPPGPADAGRETNVVERPAEAPTPDGAAPAAKSGADSSSAGTPGTDEEAKVKPDPSGGSEKERAAREAFENISSLVEKGAMDDARFALAAAGKTLAGTEYHDRAESLILQARGRLAIAEVYRLERQNNHQGAIQVAERALREKLSDLHRTTLDKLVQELHAKVAELKDAERKELAAAERRREKDRERREEEQRREEERARLARRRDECDKLRRESKRAASRRDYFEALRLLKQAEGLATDVDDLSSEIAAEITQVKADEQATKARALIEAKKIDEGIAAFETALTLKGNERLAAEFERLKKTKPFLVLANRADGLASKGDWEGAVAAYGKAKDVAAGLQDVEGMDASLARMRVEEIIAKAEGLARSERWREAKAEARKALSLHPKDSQARSIMSKARDALGPRDKVTNSIGMRLIFVPAAAFVMGSEKGGDDETPAHKVRLGAYYIGLTEVTNAQFEEFAPQHRRKRGPESPGEKSPVVNVSYEDALAFCEWLSRKEAKTGEVVATYRLPTEAEWEYAARGGSGRAYPWGYELPGEGRVYRCNFHMRARRGAGRDGHLYAAPVGQFADWVSPSGCLDMAGNAAEWCSDWYDEGYYAKTPIRDPTGPKSGQLRVVRGGSWQSDAEGVRSAKRSSMMPTADSPTVGFRLVGEVEEQP